jgi:hypothetical protein
VTVTVSDIGTVGWCAGGVVTELPLPAENRDFAYQRVRYVSGHSGTFRFLSGPAFASDSPFPWRATTTFRGRVHVIAWQIMD